uniref:Mastermind-like protein 3 n=1 Tax=Oncorhynchus kisutch TaxID=8019 RepID=A0A8C7JFE8_ONCKI
MNQGIPGGSVGPQPDMGLPYGGQGAGQQSLYSLNPSMSQMMQQVGGGYGGPQGMMMNSMSQQPLKGPPKAQAQRLGGYGSMQPGPGQQPPHPRLAKQHFPGHPQGHPQAMGQGQPMDPRAMNPAAGMAGPMIAPHMAGPGQPRTNQPRPMVMPGQGVMGQGVPNMGAFGQGPAMGVGPGGGGGYVGQGGVGVGGQPQGYQRTSSQDLSSYGYVGGQVAPSGGGFGLADGTGSDLDSSDGWMEEFFPNQ